MGMMSSDLSRRGILTGLTTASRSCLLKRRADLHHRIKDMQRFIPEWPALAESFEQDVRWIDERLKEMVKP